LVHSLFNWLFSFQRISQLGETLKFPRGERVATKTTLQDIQKLEVNFQALHIQFS